MVVRSLSKEMKLNSSASFTASSTASKENPLVAALSIKSDIEICLVSFSSAILLMRERILSLSLCCFLKGSFASSCPIAEYNDCLDMAINLSASSTSAFSTTVDKRIFARADDNRSKANKVRAEVKSPESTPDESPKFLDSPLIVM